MSQSFNRISLWGACLLVAAGGLRAWAAPPAETLFPNTTAGFLAIANYPQFEEQFNKTQLGKLMADPQMKPFAEDLRRQLQERWSGVRERLGLTFEDLKGVPGGEVAVGLVRPTPNQAVLCLKIDVNGHIPQAKAMLQKLGQNTVKSGGKQEAHTIGDTSVIFLELPKRPTDELDAPPRKAYYFLMEKENLLGAADNLEVLQGMLVRFAGKKGDSLADVPAFQIVIERCKTDAGHAPGQARWFIHPLTFAEALRTSTPERQRQRGKSIVELLQRQGFDAIQGFGGMADFAAENFELVHRTAIHAPPPHEKAMKMLVFPNSGDFTPQRWVPRDLASYATFYVDVLNGFDNFGPLFDELFGEGEKGVWADVLKGLKEDPHGPQIDLRSELIAHLANRVSVLGDYQLPITPQSQRVLFAIETKNAKAVAAGIEKLMKNDKTVRRREFEGHVIWEVVQEEADLGVPNVEIGGGIPSLTPMDEPKDKEKKEKEKDSEEQQPRLLPHAALTVANGHLLIASHLDFLEKVLKVPEERQTLARAIDYRLITATLDRLGIKEQCARVFTRTDEEYRPTYELIRQGKMPENESLMSRLMTMVSGEGKKGGVRPQKIDGSKLPDYEVVRRSLGPAGVIVTSERSGWFIKGMTLSKESPPAPAGIATGEKKTAAPQ